MISKTFFNTYNYGSLILAIIFVVLMYFELVPRETFIYIAAFTILLLVVRIFLRVYYIKQSRKNSMGG